MPDLNVKSIRFKTPVQVVGEGMVDRLDFSVDPDTGKPKTPGASATFLVDSRMVRIVTAGETWVPVENVSSFHVQYPDRVGAKKPK